MTRHAHRAQRRPKGRRVSVLVASLLGLGVVVGLLATVQLSGVDGSVPAATPLGSGDPASGSATAEESGSAEAAPSPSSETSWAPRSSYARPGQEVLQARTLERKPPEPKPEQVVDRKRAEKLAREVDTSAPFEFTVGSFNVLGSQHTAPGGDRRNFPPASIRSAGAASLMAKHGVDIVGTQELQADQLAAVQSRTGLAAFPGTAWGSAETDNSILYDADRFEQVGGSSFTIPFMGRPRPQPILRLRERVTGREFYVVNSHPSAGDGRYLAERRRGQATLVAIVNDLQASGLPVIVTGDMNDRQEFFCRVVAPAGLTAPNGGSYSSGCAPPPEPLPVDWVVGSGVTWSGYWRDTTPVTQRTSDHFFISATAHVG